MQTYSTILTEKRDRILRLTFNRPERLNAVSLEMHRELSRIFFDAAEEPDVDLIVLTGAGRAFSAGGDMAMLEQASKDPAMVEEIVRHARLIATGLLQLDTPVIAAVNGDAVGLGCTIALMCDVIIAAESVRFGDPHVRVGLAAGDGGALIWPRLIGPARAKEYLLTGKLMSTVEAERTGLINAVVPLDELEAAVAAMAESILKQPRMAVRLTKRAVNASLIAEASRTLELSLNLEAQTMASADFAEAVVAFQQKRTPKFTGR